MGNFVPLPGYPYANKDPLPHGDVNTLSEALVKAHNADEGSDHAPTATSTWSGSMGFGWSFADAFPLDGEVDVSAGLVLDAAVSGSVVFGKLVAVDVRGPLTFKQSPGGAPGSAQWESGASATFLASSTLTLASGATASLTGTTNVRGPFTIKAGASGQLIVEAGTTNLIAGLCDFLATSEQRFTAGSKLTGTIEVSGGASSITFKDSIEIELDPARAWHRHATRVAATSYDAGVPQAADNMFSPLFAAPSLYTLAGSTSPVVTIFEIEPPPDGSLIVSATVKSIYGSIVLSTLAVATYELVKWQNGLTAAPVSISPLTSDTHATNGSDWNTVKTVTVTADANTITDRAYRYGLRVTSSFLTGTSARLEMFYDIAVAGTAAKITGT